MVSVLTSRCACTGQCHIPQDKAGLLQAMKAANSKCTSNFKNWIETGFYEENFSKKVLYFCTYTNLIKNLFFNSRPFSIIGIGLFYFTSAGKRYHLTLKCIRNNQLERYSALLILHVFLKLLFQAPPFHFFVFI